MKRQLHLNLFIHSRGHHEASWRHPASSPLALTDIRYYQDLAQRAEAALFDSIFLADQLALGEDVAQAARTWLEPLTVLAAVAVVTKRVGLIATASTTYTEPFNLARQFASLDHISNGRVAWNIVTSWLATAARNFGGAAQVSHADRYARAEEFMKVIKALWDSWADDAVIDDRAGGRYTRPDRIRPINHRGDFYQVAGPLNMPRCPQGRPVLVQAGSSDTGRRFAARHADAVFTAHMAKTTALEFYANLKALAAAEERSSDQVLILPGLSPMIGSTEAEAQRMAREINDLTDPEVGRKRLSGRFGGYDFSHLSLDRPLSPEDFPDPDSVEAGAQPDRGDFEPGPARQTDPPAVAGLPCRRPRPPHHRGYAGADGRFDRGLVYRRRGGWLQHHAATAASAARGLRHRSNPSAAAAGAVPEGLYRRDTAGALRPRLAEERLSRACA
jgi:FMN-dependent oxidoreductase (nitrilotriacetate monooxygenase family)